MPSSKSHTSSSRYQSRKTDDLDDRDKHGDSDESQLSRSRRHRSSKRSSRHKSSHRRRSRSYSTSDGSDSAYSRSVSPSSHVNSSSKSKSKHRRHERKRSRSRSPSSRHHKSSRRKKEKESRKTRETSSERRERKLAKKRAKAEMFAGYTNEENPFGDMKLHEAFVWKKKHQKEIKEGRSSKMPSAKELKHRRNHLITEIEKVKKRREEREAEREERERLRAEEDRLKEQAQYGDWAAREELFEIEQLKKRSIIRLRDGREKPVDILAKNILLLEAGNRGDKDITEDPTMEAELENPYKIISTLCLEDLEELQKDIQAYQENELASRRAAALEGKDVDSLESTEFTEYWDCLQTICTDKLMREDARKRGKRVGIGGIHSSVEREVRDLLDGKSYQELKQLEDTAKEKLRAGEERAVRGLERAISGTGGYATGDKDDVAVDTYFWDGVKSAVGIYKAKARLRQLHEDLLMRRLQQMDGVKGAALRVAYERKKKASQVYKTHDENDSATYQTNIKAEQQRLLKEGDETITQASARDIAADGLSIEEAQRRGIGNTEENLTDEEALEGETSDVHLWQDKYRPRKPRFFNRVKTGWDWNQYNKTHYDKETPPPKVVQGYKFNIFYPDLIDKSATPTYTLEPADSPDFCIIRFHAGPPYEDIAFKIVNQEWNMERRYGFKATFDRGILQLHFNFKRARYKR